MAASLRDERGATTFAPMTRFALAMLEREETVKRGIAAKRRIAGWDNPCLRRVMTAGPLEVHALALGATGADLATGRAGTTTGTRRDWIDEPRGGR